MMMGRLLFPGSASRFLGYARNDMVGDGPGQRWVVQAFQFGLRWRVWVSGGCGGLFCSRWRCRCWYTRLAIL